MLMSSTLGFADGTWECLISGVPAVPPNRSASVPTVEA